MPQMVPEKLLLLVPIRLPPLAAKEGTEGLTVIVAVMVIVQLPMVLLPVNSTQEIVPLPLPPPV